MVLSLPGEDKVTLQAVCGKDAVAKGVKAGDIIRTVAPLFGGKGGGRPDSAMGGGTGVDNATKAFETLHDMVKAKA